MIRWLLGLLLLVLASFPHPAAAQLTGPPAVQGSVTSNHCVAWVNAAAIKDAGGLCGGLNFTQHGAATVALGTTETLVATCNNSDSACTAGTWNAAATWTLPALASINKGDQVVVIDAPRVVTATLTLTLDANGTDVLNGSAGGSIIMNAAGQVIVCYAGAQWDCTISTVAATATANQFQYGIDTSGNPLFRQPTYANLSGSVPLIYATASGATTLHSSNCGDYIVTSGTWTLNADTGAQLGANCFIYIANGSGVLSVGFASDGLSASTWSIYPNEIRVFISDGTNVHSFVIDEFKYLITATGTTTLAMPPGYVGLGTDILGGGGQGGGGPVETANVAASGGAGGGGGGRYRDIIPVASLTAGTAFKAIVGTGGTGAGNGANAAAAANGTAGAAGTASCVTTAASCVATTALAYAGGGGGGSGGQTAAVASGGGAGGDSCSIGASGTSGTAGAQGSCGGTAGALANGNPSSSDVGAGGGGSTAAGLGAQGGGGHNACASGAAGGGLSSTSVQRAGLAGGAAGTTAGGGGGAAGGTTGSPGGQSAEGPGSGGGGGGANGTTTVTAGSGGAGGICGGGGGGGAAEWTAGGASTGGTGGVGGNGQITLWGKV